MLSLFKKRKSIFSHILIRGAIVFIIFNLIYLGLVIPFSKNKAKTFIDNQAQTFFNSSVVAIKNDIYQDNYSKMIELLMKLVKESDLFEYVILDINTKEENQILITGESWRMLSNQKSPANSIKNNIFIENNAYTNVDVYEYLFQMSVHDLPLGEFTLGASTKSYDATLKGMYKFIIILNILQIITTIVMLVSISKKLRNQIGELQSSAEDISVGEYDRKIGSMDILEVNNLANTFNIMADSINEQTSKSEKLAKVVKNTKDGILIINDKGDIDYANKSFVELFRRLNNKGNLYNISCIKGCEGFEQVFDTILRKLNTKNIELPFNHDISTNIGDVEYFYDVQVDYFEHDNDTEQYFLVLSDITTRKRLERELNQYAFNDKLTNLPNRRAFIDKLDQCIGKYSCVNIGFTLIFIDLDDFKIINDTLGHDYGDELLKVFANILKTSVRDTDVVSRLGGDEFTIILQNGPSKKIVKKIAKTILNKIAKPVAIKDTHVKISSSIGVVNCPDEGMTSSDLMKKADQAMYQSKNSGKNKISFYDNESNLKINNLSRSEDTIISAVDSKEINLWYQPQIIITSNEIRCLEGLMRWETKIGNVLKPASFNALDVKSNLAFDIGNMAINQACQKLKELEKLGLDQNVAVNIYPKQLEDEYFVDKLINIAQINDINLTKLEMEISGKCITTDNAKIITNLIKLNEISVPIVLDGIEENFQQLLSMNKIQINAIKIKRNLIENMMIDKVAKSVTSSIIHFGLDLGIVVVAVGVERENQLEKLASMQCTVIQGSVFYDPVPTVKVNQILQDRQTSKLSVV